MAPGRPAGDQQSVDETQGKRQPTHGGEHHRSKKKNTSSEPDGPQHSLLHSQQEMRRWEQGDQGTGQPSHQHRGNHMFIGSEGTKIMGQRDLAQAGRAEDEKKTPDIASRSVMKTSQKLWSLSQALSPLRKPGDQLTKDSLGETGSSTASRLCACSEWTLGTGHSGVIWSGAAIL